MSGAVLVVVDIEQDTQLFSLCGVKLVLFFEQMVDIDTIDFDVELVLLERFIIDSHFGEWRLANDDS